MAVTLVAPRTFFPPALDVAHSRCDRPGRAGGLQSLLLGGDRMFGGFPQAPVLSHLCTPMSGCHFVVWSLPTRPWGSVPSGGPGFLQESQSHGRLLPPDGALPFG